MSYPLNILPSKIRKKIDCEVSENIIARYTKVGKSELLEEITSLIKEEHICSPRENMVDLSISLLGAFELKHLQIELTESGKLIYNHYCEPNIEVEVPTENLHYRLNLNRHYWWLQIKEIDLQKVNYSMSNSEYSATCHVLHTPMKWNYWHFSIRWETHLGFWDSIEDRKTKEKLGKKLGHEARSFVKMFAKVTEEPNYYELDKKCYCSIIE